MLSNLLSWRRDLVCAFFLPGCWNQKLGPLLTRQPPSETTQRAHWSPPKPAGHGEHGLLYLSRKPPAERRPPSSGCVGIHALRSVSSGGQTGFALGLVASSTFTVEELRVAGFLAKAMKNVKYSLAELKGGNLSAGAAQRSGAGGWDVGMDFAQNIFKGRA